MISAADGVKAKLPAPEVGLTIAVRFVVDDAIVILENIFCHIGKGMESLEAALVRASEIGFTIVSISFSLIAVFIPLLLIGSIVGGLLRAFAICVSITRKPLGFAMVGGLLVTQVLALDRMCGLRA